MSKENLFDLIRKEQVVIWAGAGFSRYAGYPSGAAFAEILYNDLPKHQREELNRDLALPQMAEEYCKFKAGSKNLVAPNLPHRKITSLQRIGIEYIHCTGEQLIDDLLKVLKENVVDDFRVGKVGPETYFFSPGCA